MKANIRNNNMQPTSALVLAGHGSHISPETAGLVWRLVDRLRTLGVADEITACFWKEAPAFHNVFDSLEARDITIVPVFTANGYFSQTVIPAEMGLSGTITMRDNRIIRYARTLGEHPHVGEIVKRRVQNVLRAHKLKRQDVAVAIIGHGTRRNAQSRTATQKQIELLQKAKVAAEVVDVYLDDEPGIPDAYTLTTASTLIAVPFFLAPGSHTTIDVPQALGLVNGTTEATINGRQVYYTPPVGTDESLCDLILELAREAGGNFESKTGSEWSSFPNVGRNGLVKMVQGRGVVVFGQLLLTPTEVSHVDAPGEGEFLTSPAALRERIRETPFRPLATAANLPDGWRVKIEKPEMLHAVVETVYPGAVADWTASRRDTFLPSSLKAVIARQTGMFQKPIDSGRADATVEKVCSRCVRYPAWYYGDLLPESIPCKEPCNLWLSSAQPNSEEQPA